MMTGEQPELGWCMMNGGPYDGSEIRLPTLLKRFVSRNDCTPVGWRIVYRRTPRHDERGRAIWAFSGIIRPLPLTVRSILETMGED